MFSLEKTLLLTLFWIWVRLFFGGGGEESDVEIMVYLGILDTRKYFGSLTEILWREWFWEINKLSWKCHTRDLRYKITLRHPLRNSRLR